MCEKPTGIWFAALLASSDLGGFAFGDDAVRGADPALDFGATGKGLVGQVVFHQEALVIPLTGIDPAAVDVRERDGGQRHAGCAGNVGLDGNVFAMIVLDGGGGLDLDHAPGLRCIGFCVGFCFDRQHHVCKGHRPLGGKTGFKDRPGGVEQGQAARKRDVKALDKGLDQRALAFGVVQLLCDLSDLMSNVKAGLGRGVVCAQFGLMDFQPHAFGTLPIGHQL